MSNNITSHFVAPGVKASKIQVSARNDLYVIELLQENIMGEGLGTRGGGLGTRRWTGSTEDWGQGERSYLIFSPSAHS